ncbi:hypothetical protein [Bacteroides sp.]|uniref:hypothetical protein n=1 Tax=Bacteroides sp. TaxID=29523 RepID=UPI0026294EDC|nr:hypothetical protein [Bacteroides sp.]MDD3038254.1 hypothetical protein [Bacteroides sp.]
MVNYGTIYTLPFKSREEVSYLIEIQKENYEGKAIELVGSGDSPFSVSIDDEDFLYTPTRFSTATICIVGGDYLQNLYSTGYQQYRVIFKRENEICWCGFVKPELYTQDYTSTKFELEIECISAMSVLEFIKYKQKDENERGFISFWDLFKTFISESRGTYSSVFIPHVYAKSEEDYNNNRNVFEEMTISEQNFFDEDDKPMTLLEILQNVFNLLNWTCVDWQGNLYFVDIDYKGDYYKYNVSLSQYTKASLNKLTAQAIGFAGSEHSLDILKGYNKATVKCSNYSIDEIEVSEDFKKLKLLSDTGEVQTSIDGKVRHTHLDVLYPSNLTLRQYTYKNSVLSVVDDLSLYKNARNARELLGALPLRYAVYHSGNNSQNAQSYSYEYGVQVRQRCGTGYDPINDKTPNSVFDGSTPIISTKKEGLYFYKGGALCLSYSIKVLQKDKFDVPFGGGIVPSEDGITYTKDKLKIRLRIGNKYVAMDRYGVFSWVDSPSTFEVNLDQSNVENPDGKLGSGFISVYKTFGVIGKYSGADGCIIELPDTLKGTLELSIYSPVLTEREGQVPYGYILKDFKLRYCPPLNMEDDNNSDRIYENVVNEGFISELDEIEFKISSYNNDGACYSKVILGDDYLKDNLYSSIDNALIRPEEALIKRIINQYGATKIKLTQILKNSESITPISILTDKFMTGKFFMITGGEIDFAQEQFTCKMIEC